MKSLVQDFRYAARVLAKTPGVTAVAVLALALGIGVNASCFLWLNALVLHPLPFPQIERVMTLWETIPKLRAERDAVAPANFFDWLSQGASFERIAAYRDWDATLTGVDDPERVQACSVTPSFFALLAMKPVLGRTFSSDEAEPGRDAVVVVSHSFWQQRLAAAPDAIGRKISLTGRTYTVVGVMPDDFDFPLATELWAPLALTPEERNQRAAHTLLVLGRLKPQVPVAQARAEMETIARRLEQQYPQTNEARDIKVVPLRELTNIGTDRFVMTLVGSAAFVLLLACANVANLQLARAAGRQKEMAVRAALGASGFRITRQLLIENTLLALIGGSLGLVLADWNQDWSRSTIPAEVYRWVAGMRTIHFDTTDFVFTLIASLSAGILCGLPAIVQTLQLRASFGEALKEGGRTSSSGPARSRLRGALVVAEVALALVLLVGAGLMVKTFHRMLTIKAGFNPNNLLTMQIALPAANYREDAQVTAFYDRVLRGLENTPQVKAAGATGVLGIAEGLYIEGRPEPRPGEPRPNVRAVSEHYTEAMGIPILHGRAISAADGAESPRVAVISESVARHYWPDADPIGHRIKLGNAQSPWLTVVGVSGDIKDWFSGEPIPRAAIPYRQAPQRSMTLYVRTTGDPLQAVKAARAEVRNADANQAVYDVKSMEQEISEETSGVRASARTMSMYAVIALLLAATGIYAVISYSVVQRTHEIGVRLALGAGRSDIVRMVVAQAFRLAALGLAIGVPAAYVLTRIMSSALYNTVTLDALTFAAFTGVLGSSALLAGYIPARRATRVDPTVALHHE
ncbi:MAG: ABC transporter permease [Acidobacteriia bacterium]|nr:ABC transporter permease [Terriglobia bacterium]